ncbi:UPF0439 protein C9orf30-like protein [Operophtera brumata]|uniref:Regulatory protein zeste n=1 Tax=Operophtera brumata TaxID=104452 RepID=A0A0L7LEI2_OPEBR|nr:UPF0439 protein C9orf30-like protein [Operophtera brumata]
MDITPKTKKAMNKDEVALLVDLIQSHRIIITKETNAATNKLKEECWASLTNTFNSKSGQIPRQLSQLKLKWDNLKKAARKRVANIRMNNLKTGGGKPDFIPPDEILDKVAAVLGSTCSGFDVPFGGDGVGDNVIIELDIGDDSMQIQEIIDANDAKVNIPDESFLSSTTTIKRKIDFSPQAGTSGDYTGEQGAKHIYGMTSMSKTLQSKEN